jgi:hypothetical protein
VIHEIDARNLGETAVARPITGSILTRRLADDTLVFDAKIRRVRRLLGPEPEWTEQRARRLMENRLLPAARLNQPWWELIPSQQQRDREPAGALTVIDACTEYVANVEARLDNKNTINAYRTPVAKHVLPYFAYEAAHAAGRPGRASVVAPRRCACALDVAWAYVRPSSVAAEPGVGAGSP